VPRKVAEQVRKAFSKLEKCVPGKPAREQPIQGQLRMRLTHPSLRLREHHKSRAGLELWQVEIPNVAILLCGLDINRGWTKVGSLRTWIYRTKDGSLHSLLTPVARRNFGASDKFELVSTRDLDGDGKGEVVFWYSGYVHDGYVLFSEGMTRMATFTWGYH
jgi:hypothetical protein